MTEDDERLIAALYVDADLTHRIVPALRQRGYECRSAIEDGLDDAVDTVRYLSEFR